MQSNPGPFHCETIKFTPTCQTWRIFFLHVSVTLLPHFTLVYLSSLLQVKQLYKQWLKCVLTVQCEGRLIQLFWLERCRDTLRSPRFCSKNYSYDNGTCFSCFHSLALVLLHFTLVCGPIIIILLLCISVNSFDSAINTFRWPLSQAQYQIFCSTIQQP